uniref:Uncharacterized protein n=1 Tax=Equus caballus TaxID=9796 RepID=A0A9L0S1Y9_HORSE
MASSMADSYGFIKVFNDMQAPKPLMPEEVKKHKKVMLFCLNKNKMILWKKGQEILVGSDV